MVYLENVVHLPLRMFMLVKEIVNHFFINQNVKKLVKTILYKRQGYHIINSITNTGVP